MLLKVYRKNLISSTVLLQHQGTLVNEFNQQAAEGSRSEECIYERLNIFYSLYQRSLISRSTWEESKTKILEILTSILRRESQTYEEVENSLTTLRKIYESKAISATEYHEISDMLSGKLIRKMEQDRKNN
jgi:hypothetical protein